METCSLSPPPLGCIMLDLLEVFRGRRLLGSETTTFPMCTQSNSSMAAWLPVCA